MREEGSYRFASGSVIIVFSFSDCESNRAESDEELKCYIVWSIDVNASSYQR